jgi:hypothetical protein
MLETSIRNGESELIRLNAITTAYEARLITASPIKAEHLKREINSCKVAIANLRTAIDRAKQELLRRQQSPYLANYTPIKPSQSLEDRILEIESRHHPKSSIEELFDELDDGLDIGACLEEIRLELTLPPPADDKIATQNKLCALKHKRSKLLEQQLEITKLLQQNQSEIDALEWLLPQSSSQNLPQRPFVDPELEALRAKLDQI